MHVTRRPRGGSEYNMEVSLPVDFEIWDRYIVQITLLYRAHVSILTSSSPTPTVAAPVVEVLGVKRAVAFVTRAHEA